MRVTVELPDALGQRVRERVTDGLAKNAAEAVVQIVEAYFEMLDDLESGHILMGRLEQD